jgi:hypothetical protein
LQDQGVTGFVEAGGTASDLSELNNLPSSDPNSSLTINTGLVNARALGTPYTAQFPAFGLDPDDITFEYTTGAPDHRVIKGTVVYSGTKIHNNFVLNVDPASGAVAFRNDSPFNNIAIDGYAIYSDSGSLLPASWNSLDDQNVADWEQAPPAPGPTVVSELKADGFTNFQSQTGFSLGNLFKTVGATQDLVFEFFMQGEDTPRTGVVVYGGFTPPVNPSPGIPGDYNGNGAVDAADYVLWRNGGPLQNEVDTPGIVNTQDYTAWRARFSNSGSGSGLGSDAGVPEPGTMGLLLLGILVHVTLPRRVRRVI